MISEGKGTERRVHPMDRGSLVQRRVQSARMSRHARPSERLRPSVQVDRQLQAERVVDVFLATVVLSLALGAVVGMGLARSIFTSPTIGGPMQTDRPRPSETRLDADTRDDRHRSPSDTRERDARSQIERWLDGEDEYVGFEAQVRGMGGMP